MRDAEPTMAPAMILLGLALVLTALSLRAGHDTREVPVEPVPVPTPAPAPLPDPVVEFRAFVKTKPTTAELVKRIEELSALRQPQVAKALLPLLRNPRHPDEVLIAACRGAGRQGDRMAAFQLLFWADGKVWKGRPAAIKAAIESAGEAGAELILRDLLKLGLKNMDRDAGIAIAAYHAAARVRSTEAVDDLVRKLARAEHSSPADPPEKKANRAAVRPVLVDLLKDLTGKDFDDAKHWREWWDDHKRTWRPVAARR